MQQVIGRTRYIDDDSPHIPMFSLWVKSLSALNELGIQGYNPTETWGYAATLLRMPGTFLPLSAGASKVGAQGLGSARRGCGKKATTGAATENREDSRPNRRGLEQFGRSGSTQRPLETTGAAGAARIPATVPIDRAPSHWWDPVPAIFADSPSPRRRPLCANKQSPAARTSSPTAD